MKSIMIKIIVLAFVFLLPVNTVFADENQESEIQQIILKIDYVAYSEHDNKYYMFTENDESGLNWGLVFIDMKLPNNKMVANILNNIYVGKHVQISFTGDLINDGENVELVDYKIISKK